MAALTSLTEEAIRSRVNLKHDNLEDVKSLSLPGTYHEKITSIGNSLRKFSRLKHLDLSRNSLTSLSGLEHMKLLERLNLYYNGISDLEELKKLGNNTNLVEVDLRLNPVTRDEPDYRLFLIHLLPNLQKLDDRGVRDRERQAALLHFTSSQAAEFSRQNPQPEVKDKQPHPRADYVHAVNKRITALDDDDVEVLDLIARTGGDLSRPRQVTGSNAKQDQAEEYSLQALKRLSDPSYEGRPFTTEHGQPTEPDGYSNQYKTVVGGQCEGPQSDPGVECLASKYPNIHQVSRERVSPPLPRDAAPIQNNDKNLRFRDEVEAYTKFKGQGFFTPHPGYTETTTAQPQSTNQSQPYSVQPPGGPPSPPKPTYVDDEPLDRVEIYKLGSAQEQPFPVQKLEFDSSLQLAQDNHPSRQTVPPTATTVTLPDTVSPGQREFLIKLFDLVDKYWNGSKSLHKNPKFKNLAVELLGKLEKKPSGDTEAWCHAELETLREENHLLKEREVSYRNLTTTSSLNETQLKASLKQAYEDVEALRSHLQKYVTENKRLQVKLENRDATTTTSVNGSSLSQSQIDQLEKQNNDLRQEVDQLRVRLKQMGQVQELAGMLQESHKSLVQTNDHLLREINETRVRHQDEVRQLHWSYDQLRKTMNSFQTGADSVTSSYYD